MSKEHILSHTGMRGVAAIVVFLLHLGWQVGLENELAYDILVGYGRQCVDLFFILSGFVMYYNYGDRGSINWRRYYAARFARIAPLYYILFAYIFLFNIYSYLQIGQRVGLLQMDRFVANFFMLSSWWGHGAYQSFITPAWSISVEFFLYLIVFPLLIWSAKRPLLWRDAVLAGIFTLLLYLAYAPFYIKDAWHISRGIYGFSAGYFICKIFLDGRAAGLASKLSYISAFLMMVFILMREHEWLVLVMPLLVLGVADSANQMYRLFGNKLFLYLGERSYSIYLIHVPVFKTLSIFLPAKRTGYTDPSFVMNNTLFIVLAVTGTLVLSEFAYRWWEMPARSYLKAYFHRRMQA